MPPLIINCSGNKLIWTRHYMELNRQSWNLTQTISHCRVFHPSIRKTSNVGTLLRFFHKICEVNKFEELQMDIDSLYLALAKEKLKYCIRRGIKAEWERMLSKGCTDSFTALAVADFFPRKCCYKNKKHDKGQPGLFKEEVRCTEKLCFWSSFCYCYDVTTNKNKVNCRCLIKRILEQSGDER